MGKVETISKSRKESTCSKCRKLIPKGSTYLKGLLYHDKPIIRCTDCGLAYYEVTTSDYVRNVGRIVEDWEEDYEIQEGTWDDIADQLEEILEEQRDILEKLPEQLQEGSPIQERVDTLDAAIDDLRSASMEDFLSTAYSLLPEEYQAEIDAAGDPEKYEEWYKTFWQKETPAAMEWKDFTEQEIADYIQDQLNYISV